MATTQSVTVGIFDDAPNVDRAVEHLATAGFGDTIVYDENTLKDEPESAPPMGPAPVGSILSPDSVSAGSSVTNERELRTVVQTFKSRLAEYHLPDEVVEAYATTFYHNGKFVLIRTHPRRDEEVVRILRKCGASRVDRY
ncbi:MAG TPA: hypothetical protein VIS96_11700 [Terrimicrobiaceae bacterium]